MKWQLGLMMVLIVVGWVSLTPDAQLPQAQWQTPETVVLPVLASSWPAAQSIATVTPTQMPVTQTPVTQAPTAQTPVRQHQSVDSSAFSTSVMLDLGVVEDLTEAQKLVARLTAEKLPASYVRATSMNARDHSTQENSYPTQENTYRVLVGPYWTAMDAQADVRSWPALLAGAQLVTFINDGKIVTFGTD